MRKMYIESFQKKMNRKIKDEEVDVFNKFVIKESRHIATIQIEKISEEEVEIIAFFHTSNSRDIKMLNGDGVKIRKIGEESGKKFEGVPEKGVIIIMKEKEVENVIEDLTDERAKEMGTTVEHKIELSEELIEKLEGKEIELYNNIEMRTETREMGEGISEHKKLDEVMKGLRLRDLGGGDEEKTDKK
jgi:pyruvate formate-lyase activating enzyme-like uncharacterized protein